MRLLVMLRHLGAFGLFALAILDGLPFPTFGGPDIFTAILGARHRDPWYEYAAMATIGSLVGAYITFRLARRAGLAYLRSKYGGKSGSGALRFFERWGMGTLVVSTAVPLPLPTSAFFAAAGAAGYPVRKYLIVVGLCRAFRYSLIAFLAEHYGRHVVLVMRHPARYWGWLVFFACISVAGVAAGIAMNRRLATTPSTR